MSGHSKWSTIKHKKAAADAKRGNLFTKLIREITVAARNGGGDPALNPALRLSVQKAKDANMPSDNIDRAIKKGTGELPGVTYESIVYEGYAQGGVAVLVEALTDNKNRTTSEVRHIFSRGGGNMAGAGSVNWIFEKKGLFVISKTVIEEEKLMDIALEAGAEDLSDEGSVFEIRTAPVDFEAVRKALEEKKIQIENSELVNIPKSTIKVDDEGAAGKILALISTLEDHDDVQNVSANFDIPDNILEKINDK